MKKYLLILAGSLLILGVIQYYAVRAFIGYQASKGQIGIACQK